MHEDEVEATSLTAAPPRLLHSDPHDFAGLYIRHRSAFTLHARHYLRDARDADEVVQEAFLRLFLALPELDTELQALAYCRRTITNLCIDRYRAQARRPHLVDIATVPLEELADDDIADPVVRAEDAALVREALSMLSPLHRAALVKREIEEKSLPVIAEELEVPEESVKHLLFRARRALRRLLAGTSLAPGGDGDGGLGATVRAGSGGLAAFVLLLALGLGSGPNLQAIPVVGVDLPDIIGVTTIARSVGSAVNDVVEKVSSGGSGAESGDGTDSGADPAPLTGADASASPSAAPSSTPSPVTSVPPGPPRSQPAPATVEPTLVPAPAPPAPAPDAEAPAAPEPSAPPSASPSPELPAESPEPEPTTGPRPDGSPSPSATPSPGSTPSDGPSPVPTLEPSLPANAGEPPPTEHLIGTTTSATASATASVVVEQPERRRGAGPRR